MKNYDQNIAQCSTDSHIMHNNLKQQAQTIGQNKHIKNKQSQKQLFNSND